jgi:hypothetical protein
LVRASLGALMLDIVKQVEEVLSCHFVDGFQHFKGA